MTNPKDIQEQIEITEPIAEQPMEVLNDNIMDKRYEEPFEDDGAYAD